jgi:hypothetical protein
MNNLIAILTSGVGASGDGSQIQTILYAVLNSLLGIAFVLIVVGAIRAAISLSHASDDAEGARSKKRLMNCIIAAIVCATALGVANALIATASV